MSAFPLSYLRLLLQEKGIETYMFERKMDNCKPCGGAIPLCMIDEFKLPDKIVDRKVTDISGLNQNVMII